MNLTVDEFAEHLDFSHPEFRQFPPGFIFEVYRRLRERGQVAYGENKYTRNKGMFVGGEWQIIGYEEVYQCAQDSKRLSSTIYGRNADGSPSANWGSIIALDPPEQNRDKKFINPYFAPGLIRTLENAVRDAADREIDNFIEQGRGDLADVAWRVPGAVLFQELLGFPVEDVQAVLGMVDRYMHPEFYGEVDPDAGSTEMYMYCYQRLQERKERGTNQENDVFDHLMNSRVEGEPLPFDQIVANVWLLVIAGLETTSNALTNSFVWMAEHPDQRNRLVKDPTMIPKAVEEFVRYTGSVHGLPRIATEDMEVAGCPIKKGDAVQLNWAAANRNPGEFENPDELIIDRDPNRHLTFGAGYHRCVGSNLARMEMRVAIEQVLGRLPDYRIPAGATPVYRHIQFPDMPPSPWSLRQGLAGNPSTRRLRLNQRTEHAHRD